MVVPVFYPATLAVFVPFQPLPPFFIYAAQKVTKLAVAVSRFEHAAICVDDLHHPKTLRKFIARLVQFFDSVASVPDSLAIETNPIHLQMTAENFYTFTDVLTIKLALV